MIAEEALSQANAELASAEKARSAGFEGRARVSARRAAGIAVRSFLGNQGVPVATASAFDILQFFRDEWETSDEVRQVIDHLLMRVNEDFHLPSQIDLVAETRWLIQTLNKD